MVMFCAEERVQDKLFKEWMTKCHSDLDKVIRFESLASDELQVRHVCLCSSRPGAWANVACMVILGGGALRLRRRRGSRSGRTSVPLRG